MYMAVHLCFLYSNVSSLTKFENIFNQVPHVYASTCYYWLYTFLICVTHELFHRSNNVVSNLND
jgi:ATP/ADP translocase